MLSRFKKIIIGLITFLPLTTLAAGYLESVATSIKSVITLLLPAMVGLVIIGFAYGLFIYLTGGEADKSKGKSIMTWGTLAVVIFLSLYGIAGLLQGIIGATGTSINVPSTATGLKQNQGSGQSSSPASPSGPQEVDPLHLVEPQLDPPKWPFGQ